VRCFAWIPNESRGWEPCDADAIVQIADQHYCAHHSETIIAAVGGRWIYFAESNGEIKIGISDDPDQRVRAFGAELLAVQPGNTRLERELHARFIDHCIRGEWFEDCEPIRAHIETIVSRAVEPEAVQASGGAEAS
jgi:hypothetical protein